MLGMRLMLVFWGPTKIYTLTMNEPEQILVLTLQERDEQPTNKTDTRNKQRKMNIIIADKGSDMMHKSCIF